jgi:hypothetical protein
VAARRIRQRPEDAVERPGHPWPMASGCSIERRFFSVS